MKSTNKDMADSMFCWDTTRTYKYGVAVRATSYNGIPDKIKNKIDKETLEVVRYLWGMAEIRNSQFMVKT